VRTHEPLVPFRRVASKALKFEIGVREKSAALRGPPFYGEEDVELRVHLIPDHRDFDPGRINSEQVADEEARLFRQGVKAQAGNRWWIDAETISSMRSLQGRIVALVPTSPSVRVRKGKGER
jgi:hypothetical protein